MKRFSFREFALLCAPIALLLGLVLVVPRLRHPPKNPNAVIALSVISVPSTFGVNRHHPDLQFAWEAKARGGPQYGFRIGYREEIVAVNRTGQTVIYNDSGHKTLGGNGSSLQNQWDPGHSASLQRGLQLDGENVPVSAHHLEWHGEFVAVPLKDNFAFGSASATTLAKWAKIKGAARIKKIVRIPFDADKNAVPLCQLEPVNATNAIKGIDTCITVESRDQDRRACRRLEAFDGHTRRVLWDDNQISVNTLWQGERSSLFSGLAHSDLLFKLRDVPPSWGEISYRHDVVFPVTAPVAGTAPRVSSSIGTPVGMKTIEALEKAGGTRFSRRLVVRAAGQTIAVPTYQKTPNLALTSLQTSKVGGATQIVAIMRYSGPRTNPEVEVSTADVFLKNQGQSVEVAKTLNLNQGKTAQQWIFKIGFSPHPPNLACRLKLQFTDNDAAPLTIERKLILP